LKACEIRELKSFGFEGRLLSRVDKFFFDKGGYLQEYDNSESLRLVPFPVCLAVKYGDQIAEECSDFVLNIDKCWVFIKTESPVPEGTPLLIHFYVPPENKLLAEIKGKVSTIDQHNIESPAGMFIKIGYFSRKELKNLEQYFEGKKHLIDHRA